MESNNDRQNFQINYTEVEKESDSNDGSSSTVTIPLGVEEGHGSEYNSGTENELGYSASEEECVSNDEYMFQYSPISEEDQQEEVDINPEDVSEENLQDPVHSEPTRSCNNCKMRTVPILSYGRAGKIRMENLAQAQLKNGNWNYEMIYAPRESIREFLSLKKEEEKRGGEKLKETLNTFSVNGQTLLHGTVTEERFDITDLLLEFGADPDIMEDGQTVAHRAAATNNTHLLRVLSYHHCKLRAWNSLGETPLMVAIALNQRESISFLWETSIISKSGRGAETVLHYAAQFNNRNVALGACDSRRGVDVNQRSLPRFESALMVAVRYGNPDIVNVLLKNGATDNNPDKDGNYAQDYIKNKQIRRIFRIWKMPVKTRKQNVPAIHNEENQRKRKRTKFELSTTESEED
ncbi:serine/threonine-protein phosphatase 6 regulatory ankyrin repeat subunit B [Daphnia magna]|uniref:serine/threonine-protein phosphatase 6 regulatory ankyrin repeat subunit B n=1 Tax=Daphnia magna TaxID=35525 RepID=UPI001E1BD5AB|nr:serine/threonine-protein phosphatase 6 regulatory ankyrin repeat subunit B [Daphnia magna]